MRINPRLASVYRLWDVGQRHLAGLRYVPARHYLEAAERLAFEQRDARTLARLYLPLLETRRQIRYHAAEGMICMAHPGSAAARTFLNETAGTLLSRIPATAKGKSAALRFAAEVGHESRRSGHWLEALLLVEQGGETRLAAAAEPTFAAGLPVAWTTDAAAPIAPSTDAQATVKFPPPGDFRHGALHALARESLLIAWEALALRWQHRHAPHADTPWEEIAWLRDALRVDPACEPVSMRLMSLAETIDRRKP